MGAHLAPDPEPATPAVEPEAEVAPVKVVQFMGKTFAVNQDVHPMAALEFAETMSAATQESMGAGKILRFATELIAPGDREAFRAHLWAERADVDDIIEIFSAEVFDEKRPTERPSDSSDGPESTSPKSGSSSDAEGSTAFPGRPDLQLIEAKMLEQQAV